MTTWTNISNASVAVGGIPSSTTVTALRDNPAALAETSSGAPVVQAGWHPYNKVTIGDGLTGLIYDYATNGTVANVTSPDFTDGYEYRIVAHQLGCDQVGGSVRLGINLYFETDAAYRRVSYGADVTPTASFGCDIDILCPRVSKTVQIVSGVMFASNVVAIGYDVPYDSTVQKTLRARVSFSGGNINGGKIWLLRRREYISSP